MKLLGTAHCESYLEVEQVVSQLEDIGLDPQVNDLKIEVEYTPEDHVAYDTKSGMISKIAEILEPITAHGISIISRR